MIINTVDYQAPIWDKCLDETRDFGTWAIFGEHTDNDTVDVAWLFGGLDIVERLSKSKAIMLIEARQTFFDAALAILNADEESAESRAEDRRLHSEARERGEI